MSEDNNSINGNHIRNRNDIHNSINFRLRTSRQHIRGSRRDSRIQPSPLFRMLGVDTDVSQRTYADVVRESLNLNELRFSNNVVPRARVQDALHDILEEIEALRDSLADQSYLKISNNLRTIYDYITQNDEGPEDSFINSSDAKNTSTPDSTDIKSNGDISASQSPESTNNTSSLQEDSKQNQTSIMLMATVNSLDDRLWGVNTGITALLQAMIRGLLQLTTNSAASSTSTTNADITIYQRYSQQLYAGIKWLILKAPARQIWQILTMTLWSLLVFIFGIIHIVVAGIEHLSRTFIKKIIIFGILLLEEIIRHEQNLIQNIQLGILYVIIAECLSICRQRIAQIL